MPNIELYPGETKRDREEQIKYDLFLERFRKVFSSPDGKVIFSDLMEQTMVFQTTFTGNSNTYFNEGKRAIGLYLLKLKRESFQKPIESITEEEIL
jgi:hypothetical protein